MRTTILALVLAFSLSACGGDDDVATDSGTAADLGSDLGLRDLGVATDSGTDIDLGTRTDSGVDVDSGIAVDSGVAVDLGTALDAGAAPDFGGAIPPGVCGAGPCPMECFRAVSCVVACGGPVTSCGCCTCAPGSFDSIGCAAPAR